MTFICSKCEKNVNYVNKTFLIAVVEEKQSVYNEGSSIYIEAGQQFPGVLHELNIHGGSVEERGRRSSFPCLDVRHKAAEENEPVSGGGLTLLHLWVRSKGYCGSQKCIMK